MEGDLIMKDRIIGHRGAGVLAPENTFYALDVAASLGLQYVEYDVRLTQDGFAVISHDDNLVRCSAEDRLISQSLYSDIKDVNVAAYFAPKTMTQYVPLFKEFLAYAQHKNLQSQIEIKPIPAQHMPLITEMLSILSETFKNNPHRPLITSFCGDSLAAFKHNAPETYKTGLLVKPEDTYQSIERAQDAQADYIHVNALYLTEKLSEDARSAGLLINAYHLNHFKTAECAVARGCERFTCDVPDLFV